MRDRSEAERPSQLHLLPFETGTGAHNLARDEALLEASGAWLRFYAWQPACVSLGYFQRFADFEDLPADLPRVRRPTGGGAILHDDELTLALVVPEALLPGPVRASYELLNEAVIAALGRSDVHVATREAAAPSEARTRWCFFHPTGLDLVDGAGAKLFGSAQRRSSGRVLHHGSLPLQRSPFTPFTAALRDRDDSSLETICDRVSRTLATSLELDLVRESEVPGWLRESTERIRIDRYEDSGWTRRC